ncbi:ribosomal protein S18-alanine N-acetyltransferase [Kineosporia sp. J2-2]|uniref:Ribosomal protein S18-alanine N-acetyltransferase n=1 Tax=Kineosporia corallincola TaxID=2835133 RepID=A0ABS5TA31_9ACTN|nr:ribosomal protein S18-alanine N-acetyltransferase [Kineosporia corallincola]MBT0767895.1 ribosomal protein S18-alanine N-acetyltransferase [Kineosporia corallincola]
MSLRLRPMRWWDVAALMPLERELFGGTAWTEEMFWSELAHPETRHYLVAETVDDEGPATVLGYAGLLAPGPEADVQTVAVAPAAQGQGVGRRLLDALIGAAHERRATSLLLEVRADNEPAIGLYGSRGFERIAIRRRYYPGDVDAWVMRLRPLTSE